MHKNAGDVAMTETNKIQISHPLIAFISHGALESRCLDYSKVKITQRPGNIAKRQTERIQAQQEQEGE